ncbi:MFS transporter [Mucilaginibacter gotjawali]|uniref:MFS family arabinose efflux permease n=2 Tax=Mucilaginibacter gotjawali TaxID=1550579 RepID=A0A839SNL4_9SPHI|nr:MFS transporter [Mucilaginibacter gotjawali]MBB3058440.1 putative MFS family arabinose efflux permease [Mucilaginibacter gotjawali]BAU53731.1 multidrug resistance protein MdtH [Mucilaginibacter gotjawali]
MLINRSGTMVVAFMSVYCVKQLHFTIEQAGIVMTIFGAGSICGGFFGGKITDKIGFYDLQVGAMMSGGILFIVLGYQHTFLSMCIGAFVLSLCNESVRPANSSAIAHYSSPENKTRSISLNRLAINIGWALGGGLGGFLAAINYHLLFWVDGGTNILAAIFLVILMPKSGIVKSYKKAGVPEIRASAYRDKTYLLFIGFGLLFFTCFYEFMIIEPAFYKIAWHFSLPFIGFLMALNGILIAIVEMVLIHNLEGRRPGLVYIYTGVFMGGLGFVLINIVPPSAIAATLIVVLITLSEMLSMPFMNSFWILRSTDHNRGQYAGLYSMAWSAAMIIAPTLGGLIIALGGFSLLWWIFAGLSFISGTGYFFMYRSIARANL